jgi:hypothetical protein
VRYRTERKRSLCNCCSPLSDRGVSMMDTLVLQQNFVDLLAEPSAVAAPAEARVNNAEIARSEDNILRWMSYLPEDCVRSMIQMGWDLTT